MKVKRKRDLIPWYFFLSIELIPNDDLMKPGQYEIEFSLDEFDQLLEIQQDLLKDMNEEEPSNGER